MNFAPGADFAETLDRQDPLAEFRKRFHLPEREGKRLLYLCGHSLGLQPRTAAPFLAQELERWQQLGVEAHFKGPRPWVSFHEELADLTARLVGAQPLEVVNMNGLTVNLHLMLVSFYRPSRTRHKILIERPAFPSDRYAVESQLRFHGLDPTSSLLEIGPRGGSDTIATADLEALLKAEGDAIAVILLPGVQYYSGQAFDMARITELGHHHGCVVGFDLAHAVGNLELDLHDWGVDFAVWCGYKYLNGGPGTTAGCFVHARHARRFELPRLAGWWGHDKASRFAMGPTFQPLAGAEGWQLSNPPVLAMAPLLASLQLFDEAGMDALRAKSLRLTGYLEFLLGRHLAEDVEILTPSAPGDRGCQLSLRLRGVPSRGRALHAALEARDVICDWREPNVLRVAPVPFYNTFGEVHRFVELLADAIASQ